MPMMSACSAFRRRKRAIELSCALAIGVVLGGCGGSFVEPTPPSIVFPDSNVSFRLHVRPFLHQSCALAACHSGAARAGNVALEEYGQLWERPGLIVPGNPDASVLQQILEGRLLHQPDPRQLSTENQRRGVRRWITEGARNN